MKVECCVNGEEIVTDVPPRLLLSDFLRHELRLTGTHVGCEMGACGACTVILDGDPVRSCLTFAAQVDGSMIVTVEGLAPNCELTALHQAFRENHGLQCGYCTPGILTTLAAVMARGLLPDNEREVRELLSGNLCRCTGYQGIVDAVLALAAGQRIASTSAGV